MKARKGFTLVELLIVIVIIGILAAAMMLSSGSATAAAEASNIISDLRSLKAASLMFYADSQDYFDTPGYTITIDNLAPYMDNPGKFTGSTLYRFTRATDDNGKWMVGFTMTGKNNDVKKKLEAKAGSTGLLAGNATNATPYAQGNDVWMIGR